MRTVANPLLACTMAVAADGRQVVRVRGARVSWPTLDWRGGARPVVWRGGGDLGFARSAMATGSTGLAWRQRRLGSRTPTGSRLQFVAAAFESSWLRSLAAEGPDLRPPRACRATRSGSWLWLAILALAMAACTEPKGPAQAATPADAQFGDAQTADVAADTVPDFANPLEAAIDDLAPDAADALVADTPPSADASDGQDQWAGPADAVPEAVVPADVATPALADVVVTDAADATQEATAATDAAAAKYTTCSALLDCVQAACSPNWDDYCAAECEVAASAAALAAWAKAAKGIAGCQMKCGGKPIGCAQACVADLFLFAKVLCVTETQSGTANCAEVANCMADTCAAKDQGCVMACAAKASASAKADLLTMIECSATSGGKGLVVGCTQQMLTCMSGGATGTASCFLTASCADGCMQAGAGDEELCLGGCYAKASLEAQKAFVPAFKCLLSAGSANDCANTLLACVPGGGAATCGAVAQCAAKCAVATPGSACTLACLDKAAPGQGANWLKLEGCMVANCKACLGKPCEATCRDANCAAVWQACAGPP